jgi:DNA replication protein DnaC
MATFNHDRRPTSSEYSPKAKNRSVARTVDHPAVAALLEKMKTDKAKEIYKTPMKGGTLPTTTSLPELWKTFRFITDLASLSEKEKEFLYAFLCEENKKREQKRIEHLMRMSGIKRIKLLADYDWAFNPKVPREKIMEFMHTEWLMRPSNLVIIGPAGVGKTHIATALCHDALMKGHQTIFSTLFDLMAKFSRAKSIYGLIDYCVRVPVLCLDELGYAVPTKEQADIVFQIISKRTEIGTTIVTTNLTPSQWGKVFDTITASAILDRLSMNGRFITFEGRSYRSRKLEKD